MADNQLFASPLRSLRQPKRTSNFTSTIESGFDTRTITIFQRQFLLHLLVVGILDGIFSFS